MILRPEKARPGRRATAALGGAMVEDSDEDEDDTEIVGKLDDVEDKDVKTMLSPEDAKYQGELADGVGRIKVRLSSHLPVLKLINYTAETPTFRRATECRIPQITRLE